MTDYELSTLIKSELGRSPNLGFTIKGNTGWIKCPWHANGREKTPSLMVNLERKITDKGVFKVGSARCHGCGKFVSHWNILAEQLQLAKTGIDGTEQATQVIADDVTDVLYDNVEQPTLIDLEETDPWDSEFNWRTIEGSLLVKVGARIMFDIIMRRQMLYLPVMVNNEHVGGVRANLVKQGKRNYFNTPGAWVKQKGLYPYDYINRAIRRNSWRTIFLVEGPRDALKSIQWGIPALGILGTGNWSDFKAEMIMQLGVDRIILGFDPDKAGDKAVKAAHDSFKNEMWVRKFTFPEGVDPGNMDEATANRILKHIK